MANTQKLTTKIKEMSLETILNNPTLEASFKRIAEKVQNGERIDFEEGILLYEKAELGYLGTLANHIRERRHGDVTYFNRNFHIEPTNLCIYTCKFCSYSRLIKQREEGWVYSEDEMMDIVKSYDDKPVTEVHIVGGVLPHMNMEFFKSLIRRIKAHRPELHIKGFTPVELFYMFKKAKLSYEAGLRQLKEAGYQSMPGGGAEIFDEEVREIICKDKCNSEQWLAIHEAAHGLDIPTNATMLYGHIEKYRHRVDHMNRLRNLQDKTGGFNCFIPLKFRNSNNEMSHILEVNVLEDLRNYAVARIYMDNFPHLKAYWPMIGRETAQLSLAFGVNDIDGTIDDTTKIYSMAGSEEQNPSLTTKQLVEMIKNVDRRPVERNTVYDTLKDYTEATFEEAKNIFIDLPVINN